ncbi:hypothetical protein HUT06_38875 [Actinomadura sp. NAK00032]|uniref:hypothetical protein n=1 Tax=Actinomadura sp. NAK00032 TaxID=2742128 RepID=UPI0015900DAA|nr:hypothetical protein [Actinomadura sp. NAK00032]QKW39262.1 hypothetical protein HUT06_38875 [Actinomadura sp. NAK00032]
MSGPEDTRETAEPAGTSGVPADPAPPSFGGGDGETATETATGTAPLRLPAFGLQAPWWAAESEADAEPAAAPPAPAAEPAAAAEPAPPEAAPAEPTPAEPAPAAPGTLVAGAGVPPVDTRGAVPAEPLVKPPVSTDDTDPDGFQAVRPEGAAPEDDTAKDDPPVDNPAVNEAAEGGPAPLSAFEKAKEAESASSAQTAVLVPDAILPPGVVPPTGSGPFPHTETENGATVADGQIPVIAPVYHTEGGVPLDTPPPPGAPPKGPMPKGAAPKGPAGGGRNKRRTVLIGAGAAVVLAAGVALFTLGGTEPSSEDGARKAAEPSAAPAPSTAAPARPSPATGPVNIADEKTDTKDLAFRDVFPQETVKLGGRTYTRDRWSLNRDVKYAARGAMLHALQQQQCRKIVRATFIDRANKLAVTSGIAVMPTKDAALAVSKAGDPAKYEWFRGMAGKHSPDIDRAGGYAAATVRGRYVAYAYVQWANGKKAEPGDPVIKQAAQQFLDYDLRPIMARARG